MPSLDDSVLDKDFNELRERLRAPNALSPAQSEPIYYLVYRPEFMLAVKRRMGGWIGALENDGWQTVRMSLADLMYELIDESKRWDTWLKLEPTARAGAIHRSIQDVLTKENGLTKRLQEIVMQGDARTLHVLTESEVLYPYFRTRAIEHALNKLEHPIVIFYPGRRSGQSVLNFLGIDESPGSYRSTIVGGLE